MAYTTAHFSAEIILVLAVYLLGDTFALNKVNQQN